MSSIFSSNCDRDWKITKLCRTVSWHLCRQAVVHRILFLWHSIGTSNTGGWQDMSPQDSIVIIIFTIHKRPKHWCDLWNSLCGVRNELHLPIFVCVLRQFSVPLISSTLPLQKNPHRTRRSVMLSLIVKPFSLVPRLRHQLLFRTFNFHVAVFHLFAKRIPRHWWPSTSLFLPPSIPLNQFTWDVSPNAEKRTSLMNRCRLLSKHLPFVPCASRMNRLCAFDGRRCKNQMVLLLLLQPLHHALCGRTILSTPAPLRPGVPSHLCSDNLPVESP